MKRNIIISFSLAGLIAAIPLIYSCGGGGGGGGVSSPPSPIMLASVDTAGTEGNSGSYWTVLSADGRYVAFESDASNLVANDTNIRRYIFVHDTATGITSLVSVSTAGTPGNNDSYYPSISSDGRYVAFESLASNLVPNDTNILSDIFLRDTASGTTSRVSVSSTGIQGNSESSNPSISSDGRYVAFHSHAGNLAANDTLSADDVFAHDTSTGITSLMSVSTAGTPGTMTAIIPPSAPTDAT